MCLLSVSCFSQFTCINCPTQESNRFVVQRSPPQHTLEFKWGPAILRAHIQQTVKFMLRCTVCVMKVIQECSTVYMPFCVAHSSRCPFIAHTNPTKWRCNTLDSKKMFYIVVGWRFTKRKLQTLTRSLLTFRNVRCSIYWTGRTDGRTLFSFDTQIRSFIKICRVRRKGHLSCQKGNSS
jgi:hypothetical protein